MDRLDLKIPRRLAFLMVQDAVLLPGASMRFLVKTERNMSLVRTRLMSRTSLSPTVVSHTQSYHL